MTITYSPLSFNISSLLTFLHIRTMPIIRIPRVTVGISTLIAILGLIVPLLTLHLGFYPWKDEEYQLMCIADYRSTPLAALTMYIGHLWSIIVGNDNIMSFRYLAYICNALSILLPCCYFYSRTHQSLAATVIFFILQLCMSLFGLFSYEWDTTTHLFLTVCCLIAVSYLDRPTVAKISLLAVFSSCAIFARIPNAAILPVALILISVSRRTVRRIACDFTVYMIVALCTSAVLIFLIWGDFQSFIASWSSDNYITGHSSLTDVLFLQVWTRYPISLRYFYMWGGVFAAICYLNKIIITRFWKYTIIVIISFSIIALWLVVRVTSDDTNSYMIDLFYFSTALIPAIAIYRHSEIRQSVLLCLTLIAFALVSYVGSDCGLYKILCMPLIPIALADLAKYRLRSVNEFYFSIAVVVVICYLPLRLKNPWTREWMNRDPATYTITKLQGIRHSDKEVSRRTKIYHLGKEIEADNKKILFLGNDRYMFDYLLGHSKDNIDRYPVQRYHDDNSFEGIECQLYDMADRFDFIYLGYEFKDSDRQKISNKLAENGFSLYLSDEDYTIWQR